MEILILLQLQIWAIYLRIEKITYIDVSKFDTSSVTDMQYMFTECDELKAGNLSMFDTSNVENLYELFSLCDKITSIDLCNCPVGVLSGGSFICIFDF